MAPEALRLELAACVLAGNIARTQPDLAHGSPLTTVISRGLNFVGEAADVSEFQTGFVSRDPLLSQPGDFGEGLTAVMPLPNSPLLNSANFNSPASPLHDQRGQLRNEPDIGAIERVSSDSLLDQNLDGIGPLDITLSENAIDFSVQRRSSRPVGIEYSPDLSPDSWIDLGHFNFSAAHPITGSYRDGSPIRHARRNGYYRAVLR